MIRILISLITTLTLMSSAAAATFTVTTTADSGVGSLRQAILDSNANGVAEPDTIAFSIPGAGPHEIAPLTALPSLTSGIVTIDGYTQPGASPNTLTTAQGGLNTNLRIAISGQNVANTDGLRQLTAFPASRFTVRGLAIAGFANNILLFNQTDAIIEGNFIGANAAGVAAPQVGNSGSVGLQLRASLGVVRIGGMLPEQRNLFVGHGGSNTILAGVGIDVIDVLTGSVTIQGNLIGTDPTGLSARGHSVGLRILGVDPAAAVTVGGSDSNARNLISGNLAFGLHLGIGVSRGAVDRTTVEGNWIGTDATGLLPLPNGTDPAVHGGVIRPQNTSGATRVLLTGNRIAFNRGRGIFASGNSPQGFGGTLEIGDNAIFGNTGLAFDNLDGPRANDPNDADGATNRMQNFPEILGATRTGVEQFAMSFRVDTAAANATYPIRVDFYRANRVGDPLARIGSASILAVDAQSLRSAIITSPVSAGFLTAIATDALGNSSEFADVVDVDRLLRDGFETP